MNEVSGCTKKEKGNPPLKLFEGIEDSVDQMPYLEVLMDTSQNWGSADLY